MSLQFAHGRLSDKVFNDVHGHVCVAYIEGGKHFPFKFANAHRVSAHQVLLEQCLVDPACSGGARGSI